jgi:predicted LPLAT superfamily acyltransferase
MRLILAGAALLLGSASGAALLFPLRPYFAGFVQRERRAVGSAARCLHQPAVQ